MTVLRRGDIGGPSRGSWGSGYPSEPLSPPVHTRAPCGRCGDQVHFTEGKTEAEQPPFLATQHSSRDACGSEATLSRQPLWGAHMGDSGKPACSPHTQASPGGLSPCAHTHFATKKSRCRAGDVAQGNDAACLALANPSLHGEMPDPPSTVRSDPRAPLREARPPSSGRK